MPPLSRAVITNCTMRKAASPAIRLDIPGPIAVNSLAANWRELVRSTPPSHAARKLYQGRSIVDAAAASEAINGKLYIVSAGLGLVKDHMRVPSYDVTVSLGSALAEALKKAGHNSSDWWDALTQSDPNPVARLVCANETYLAMPASYIRMLRHELESIDPSMAGGLRIFTSLAGRKEVPRSLLKFIIPYDDRLEGVRGYNGTRSDFPQRALRHFVERVGGPNLCLTKAVKAVEDAMIQATIPSRPKRTKATDEEICELIRSVWIEKRGSSNLLLRYLRDEAHVACEQSRFRDLWRHLAMELSGRC